MIPPPDTSNAEVSGMGRRDFRAVGRCVVVVVFNAWEWLRLVLFTVVAVDSLVFTDCREGSDASLV